jgi:hypothetical protein
MVPSSGLGNPHDKELEEEIRESSVAELRKRAMDHGVDPAKLEAALDQLHPCKDHDRANIPADHGPLRALIIDHEGSAHRRALIRLQAMSVSKS